MNFKLIVKLFKLINGVGDVNFDIHFYGGEPLLNYSLIKKSLFLFRNAKNIKYLITTNGTLLNKKILELLLKYNFKLCLSLDGNEEIQNKNRLFNNCNSYSWFIKNKELILFPRLDSQVTMVINKANVHTLAKQFNQFFKLGIRSIYLTPATSFNNKLFLEIRDIDVFKYQFEKIYRKYKNCKIIDNLVNNPKNKSESEVNNLTGFTIDTNGDIYLGEESCWMFTNYKKFISVNLYDYDCFSQLILDLDDDYKKILPNKEGLRKEAFGRSYYVSQEINKIISNHIK